MENQIVTAEKQVTQGISDQAAFIAVIERIASNPDVDVEKMKAILDMQERVMNKKAEISFNQAMSRLSGKLPRITRHGKIAHAGKSGEPDKIISRYARYEDIDRAIRPLLAEEGFSLSFDSEFREGGGAVVTGKLSHQDGHFETAAMALPLDVTGAKNNVQAMGSTLKYGQRYTACMLLNIVTENEDDDGSGIGQAPIDMASVCHLNALIEETKSNRAAFLKMMGVEEVDKILSKDYAKAVNALMTKKSKMLAGVQ